MSAQTRRRQAPARYGVGAGAPSASPRAATPAQTPPSSSGDSGPLSGISSAVAGFLASGVAAAQVALGAGLLGVGLLLLVSQTSAGAQLGRTAAAGARRGARLIPGVGALA